MSVAAVCGLAEAAFLVATRPSPDSPAATLVSEWARTESETSERELTSVPTPGPAVKSVFSAGGTYFFSKAVSLVAGIESGLAIKLLTAPGV